jgi:hypothetical protein
MTQALTPQMKRSWLIATLRDPTLWPTGFQWYYGSCNTCAMGLLRKMLRAEDPRWSYTDWTVHQLGMEVEDVRSVFCPTGGQMVRNTYGTSNPVEISPLMVAAELEKVHHKMEKEDELRDIGQGSTEGGSGTKSQTTGHRGGDSGEDRIHSGAGDRGTRHLNDYRTRSTEYLHSGPQERLYSGWDLCASLTR